MKKFTVVILLLAILLLSAVAGLVAWKTYGQGGVPAGETTPTEVQAGETGEVLTETPTEETTEEPTEAPTEYVPAVLDLDYGYPVMGANHEYSRADFASITLVNSLAEAGENAWDMSAAKNGAILGWTAPSRYADGLLDLYIGCEDTIYAGEKLYFEGFVRLQKLTLSGLLDTSNTTSLTHAFWNMGILSPVPLELDLSGLDVSNVKSMDKAFSGCATLASLNLSGWDVSGVMNCSQMFFGCRSLTHLDTTGWKLPSGCQADRVFADCNSLTDTQEIADALGISWEPASKLPYRRVTELTSAELVWAANQTTSAGFPLWAPTCVGDVGKVTPQYGSLDLDRDGIQDTIHHVMDVEQNTYHYELHLGTGEVIPMDGVQDGVGPDTWFLIQDLNGTGKDDIVALTRFSGTGGSSLSFCLFADINGKYRKVNLPNANFYMEDLRNGYARISFPYNGYMEVIPFDWETGITESLQEGGTPFGFYFGVNDRGDRTDSFHTQDVKIDGNKLVVMYNFRAKHGPSVSNNPTAIVWSMDARGNFKVERIGTDVIHDYWLK